MYIGNIYTPSIVLSLISALPQPLPLRYQILKPEFPSDAPTWEKCSPNISLFHLKRKAALIWWPVIAVLEEHLLPLPIFMSILSLGSFLFLSLWIDRSLGYYILVSEKIHQEDIVILNTHVPNSQPC